MPETYKQCSVWEVAISTVTRTLDTSIEEGDIVAVRPVGPSGIGTAEMRDFLWVRVCGWDDAVMARLADPIRTGNESVVQKRRFKIPLTRLASALRGFQMAAARDRRVAYQPCLVAAEPEYRDWSLTNVEMDTLPGYQGVGRVRLLPPEPLEVVHCSEMTECSPTVQVQVPSGWSWLWRWKRDMAMTRDQLKAEYRTTRWQPIAARMRDETRRLKTDGPLIEIVNPQGQPANTSISATVTMKKAFPGRFVAETPPLPVSEVVYDTQQMRMVGGL